MNSKKSGDRYRILILDQGRQALPFLKSFYKKGYEVIIVCNKKLSEGYFSRYPSKRLVWPSYVTDRKGFEQRLLTYLENNKIDATISVGDISSEIISVHKDIILKYTGIVNPDYNTFLKAADKLLLMSYCMEKGFPCPLTYHLTHENLDKIDDLLNFPVIVKPIRGVGAVGLKLFEGINELKAQYDAMKQHYGDLIIQEYIPKEGGMQYQAEAFLDEKSRLKACMVIEKPRYFPVSGGTSTANVTIQNAEIESITRKLLESLMWTGAADIDFIYDPRDEKMKILEINPRVTAGIKIAFAAGIDFADLHLKLALGKEVPLIKTYKTGVYCRNMFLDILWYIYSDSESKRKTKPSFYKFFGKNVIDQLFSFDDPLPAFGFFLNMIKKYSNINRFRSKFHS